MLVETNKYIYETKLNLIQIEMTGFCNMNCKHCRAKDEPKVFFEEKYYKLLLEVIKEEKGEDFKLTFSGGEPFIHPKLINFIELAKKNKIENIVITTNGSLVTKEMLDRLNSLNFKNLIIQLSLDDINPDIHDTFRGFPGAFKKCGILLEEIKKYNNINSSIRMTVNKDTVEDMEKMVQYAISKKCKIIGFGSIIPFGKAEDCSMSFNSVEKKQFLTKVCELNVKYQNEIEVVTEDPLKSIVANSPWAFSDDDCNNCSFGGCTAGIDSLNIQCNGIITPCSMIKEQILNLKRCNTVQDFKKMYEESTLIKKIFERKFEGKCNKCKFKYLCGGCRASAKGRTNNLFGSDESCWLEND